MPKKFKDFIFEKVNKNEINQILKDNSIYVGGEFEFFCTEAIDGVGFDEENFEMLHQQWFNLINDAREYYDDITSREEEVQEEITKLENEKDKLVDIRIELDSEKDFLERNGEETDEIENEMNVIDDEIDRINDEIDEKEDERMAVLVETEPPYIPESLIEYAKNIGSDIDLYNFDWLIVIEYFDDVMMDLRRLEPDEKVFVDEDSILEETMRLLENETSINVDVSNFSPKMGDDEWTLTTDSSVPIDEGGVELISPPLPMPEFIEKMNEVFDFINSNGETDSRTGFHVHMSIEGVNLEREMDVVKLFLFHDEEYTYNFFRERKGNHMAMSIKKKLQSPDFSYKDLEKIMKVDKLEKDLSTSKFYGINLSYINQNHIEYRYMGGSKYENKFDQVKSTIANYAFNLKLACNPQFKRQEYVKKLVRMIDKKMEKNKPYILAFVICDFIQNTVQYKIEKSNLVRLLQNKLQEIKHDFNKPLGNMSPYDVVRTYKSMKYSKKEIMEGLEVIFRKSDIEDLKRNDDIKEYLEGLYKNPKKLMKEISDRYKDVKPISKVLR